MATTIPPWILNIKRASNYPLNGKKRIDFYIESHEDSPLVIQEQARLITFLTSETCPIKCPNPGYIKVFYVPTSTDTKTEQPGSIDRNFVRFYFLGRPPNILKVSGIERCSETS